MWPNLQFPADLVTFTEETLNGKLHILCIVSVINYFRKKDSSQIPDSILTLSRRWSLSYWNQSIDLLCKSMDWFLYVSDLYQERVKFSSGVEIVRI